MTWLKRILAAIWAALTTPVPPPVEPGGGSSPPIEPDNPVPIPPDAGGGAGSYPYSRDNPDPRDEGKEVGNYDSGSKWKPAGDHTGKAVFLVDYRRTFTAVTIGTERGNVQGRNNGHRIHVRWRHHGRHYTGQDILAVDHAGVRWRARIGNGAREQRLSWTKVRG